MNEFYKSVVESVNNFVDKKTNYSSQFSRSGIFSRQILAHFPLAIKFSGNQRSIQKRPETVQQREIVNVCSARVAANVTLNKFIPSFVPFCRR